MTMTDKKMMTYTNDNNGEVHDKGTKMTDENKADALGALMKGTKANNKFCQEIGQIEGGHIDVTPMVPSVGQVKTVCVAGNKCKAKKEQPVGYGLRCMVCRFCLHATCGLKIESSAKKTPHKKINRICLGCVHTIGLEAKTHKTANEEVVNLRHARLHKYLRESYPKLVLLEPCEPMDEEEGPGSDNEDMEKGERKDGSKATAKDSNVDELVAADKYREMTGPMPIAPTPKNNNDTRGPWKQKCVDWCRSYNPNNSQKK